MSGFTYVSLFSGIGGFEQALDKLGGTCVLASEIDKFANQAYEVLYGQSTAGDITEIDAKDVPDHDLLVGGFPCQSFSVAGKRGGFDDARGTLFFEVARIASEKQPSVLLLENVKGLVSHDKGKTLDTIVKTLNDIGYRVDFDILNSKFFGVPQNRERIFIVAVREDLVENEPWEIEGTTIIPKGKRRISGYDDVKTFNFDFPQNDEVTTRLRDILETDVDEKYYLSEEKTEKLVAQLEEQKAPESTGNGLRKQAQEVTRLTDESGTLRARDCKGFVNQEMTGVIEPQMVGHVEIKGYDAIKRVYSAEGISPTLTTMGGGHREPKIAELQEIRTGIDIRTEKESTDVKEKERNTVEVLRVLQEEIGEETVAEWRLRVLDTFHSAEILQSGMYEETSSDKLPTYILGEQQSEEREIKSAILHRLTDLSGVWFGQEFRCSPYRQQPLQQFARELSIIVSELSQQSPQAREILQDLWETAKGVRLLQYALYKIQEIWRFTLQKARYRIRKLSPLECFRLQGFPDLAHQTLVDAGISDSQRYKMAGNAVTVNVIEAIGANLLPLLERKEEKEELCV